MFCCCTKVTAFQAETVEEGEKHYIYIYTCVCVRVRVSKPSSKLIVIISFYRRQS